MDYLSKNLFVKNVIKLNIKDLKKMKTLFIPAKSNVDITNVLKKFKVKEKIGTITTIQFLDQVKKLKNFVFGGQILGCNIKNAEKINNKVNSFLYIGSGKFHPLLVAYKLKKPVYIANPLTNEISQITNEDIKEYEKRRKGSILRFLTSNKFGIIVSTKSGQNNLNEAIGLQKKLKNSFIFITDEIREEYLENFPDIECWINTACPRISLSKMINLEDVIPNLRRIYPECNT